MEKGKFWAVLNMDDQHLTFCRSQGEADSIASERARRNPLRQFVVVESLHAFVVETPVVKVDASEIFFGKSDF